MHVAEQLTAEAVFGKHALHHLYEKGIDAGFEMLVVGFFHKDFGSRYALSAGIACVTEILTVGHFFTGEDNLVSIDDNHIVAAFYIGRVAGFVFAAEDLCDFGAEAAEDLILGVYDYPLSVAVGSLGRRCS